MIDISIRQLGFVKKELAHKVIILIALDLVEKLFAEVELKPVLYALGHNVSGYKVVVLRFRLLLLLSSFLVNNVRVFSSVFLNFIDGRERYVQDSD